MAGKPALLPSILRMKCPNCRKGHMFDHKSIFPLKSLLKMPQHCPVCGQKMELEIGFYYGTGYVSYGLCVAIAIAIFVAYAVLVGFSWKDNSIWWYLGITFSMLTLLQPWLMRLSRVLYLYMFVKYGSKPYTPGEPAGKEEAAGR